MSIDPGQTCPECKRRVPFPKKADSPKSTIVSYRLPLDEMEAHVDTFDAVARYIGTAGRPHDKFWTITYALARVLQDPEMQGIAQRAAA